MFEDGLPPIPLDDWREHQTAQFTTQTDAQIATLAPGGGFDPSSMGRSPDPVRAGAVPEPDLGNGYPSQDSAPAPLPEFPTAPTLAPPTSVRPAQPSPAAPPPPVPSGGLVEPSPISGPPDLIVAALNAADKVGIDPHLFVSLIQQESGFDPNARSPVGAQGLSQLMPETARGLGVSNPNDPLENLTGGARYLKQQLDRFGGDVVKALAAYNAGPGAVEQYGGVPPYKETQKYVDTILSRMAAEQSTSPSGGQEPGPVQGVQRAGGALSDAQASRDISQFGDSTLTADEAYAACGPAAAVRFASAFGRNPTLREATDLAKTVGWTSAQGMAGLSSEKALMDKLPDPVATKLVNGPAWDAFSREAATGNPVIISTAGHYFTADGFNPDTGQFHVGKSGSDLKRGSEWMTPKQMTDLMGEVQGGLLADNPEVAAPSTVTGAAAQTSVFGGTQPVLPAPGGGYDPSSMQAPVAPQDAAIPARPVGAPLPSGGPTVFDQVGPALAEHNRTSLAALDREPGPGLDALTRPGGAAALTGMDPAGEVTRGVGQAIQGAQSGDYGMGGVLGGALQAVGGVAGAIPGAGPASKVEPLLGPAARDLALSKQSAEGTIDFATGGASRLVPGAEKAAAYDPVKTASPELQRLGQMFEPTHIPPSGSVPERIKAAFSSVQRNLTRGLFDRQVDITQMQEKYAKALGRPLNADEMAAELQRLESNPAAAVKIDEGLKPAIQSVGDDYKALRDYVTLRSNVQVADALGNDARAFSGGLTKADSAKAMTDLEQTLGPDRFATVKTAADQVSQLSKDTRQRLVDAGVFTPQQAADMEAKYPDWAKTRILDYMKDPVGGQGAGTKISMSNRDLHEYSLAGTTRVREDPIASTAGYVYQAERMAMKNEAFNAFLKVDQAGPTPFLRKVAQDFSPTRDQVTMTGFVHGEKVKYVTDNKWVGAAINGTDVMSAPSWTRAWGQVFRSLATSRNPLFLAGNAALDIPTYVVREAVRAGGPQHLPQIFGELAKGYADSFQGLLQGEFRGNTARFLKGGGGTGEGFTSQVTSGEGNLIQKLASSNSNVARTSGEQLIRDLRRSNVFEINTKGDLARLAKDLVTLQPVESLGQRIEYGPRVASMRLAEKRGQNATQAIINGRTVTVDFSQGGTVTKYLNNFIPFFNVGFQGPVQVARAFRENPGAFLATSGSIIGLPAIAAEVWNRSDPQRAADYKDVPDYVKNQGIVVMLPGTAPVDKDGNRKPLYAVIKLREWSPFASIARDATSRVLGDDTKSWDDMAKSASAGVMPNNATSVGQLGVEPLAGIPVLPAAAQLSYNKDFFRNRDIVTQRNDDNASQIARTLTPVFQTAVDKLGLAAEIRPSAIDFLIRDQGAGVGAAVIGASDLGQQRKDNSPQTLPVVGGLVGRFAGSQGGEAMQQARDTSLSAEARTILRQNGVNVTPGSVSSTVNGVPLRMSEQTKYQQLANQYIDEAIHKAPTAKDWPRMNQQAKETLLTDMISAARQRAGEDVLRMLPVAELRQRQLTKSSAP